MQVSPQHAFSTAPIGEEQAITQALSLGWWLLQRSGAFATQLADLGEIDLPAAIGGADDQARLQAVAPLYLAAELEQTRLLAAVETLAGLYASGGIEADLGPAGPSLLAFWQQRHQRFAAPERAALFNQLFGHAAQTSLAGRNANTDFESAMINLTEALHRFRHEALAGALPPDQTTLALAARNVAGNLVGHAGGIAAFAARDLLTSIQQAVDVLKQPLLQRAFGATTFWGAVQNVARAYLEETPNVQSHVTRGRAGMIVITWLGQVAHRLDGFGQSLVAPDHPVLAAATAWLQASLDLAEQAATYGQKA